MKRTESSVKERYSEAAQTTEPALCCAVEYDMRYLEVLPKEVIEKDYGCGDPSRYLRPGETVLDLGSGTGKICFIASQVVGPTGRVIGVDMTDDMLEVARRNAPIVAERIGYANVEFRKGRIQDLALDLDVLNAELSKNPIQDVNGFLKIEEIAQELRHKEPLIADASVDVVVSNCVLNLVEASAKRHLFHEIYRVLKPGGRAVISDIVSDRSVPESLQHDPILWSGCISGAIEEAEFLRAFEEARFYGIRIVSRDIKPWQTVQGIEFRAVTIEAFKGENGTCLDLNHAVIYRGPFREVFDDDNHRLRRGERVAVCEKTFNSYGKSPYLGHFELLPSRSTVDPNEATSLDCNAVKRRTPQEIKGATSQTTTSPTSTCTPGTCC
jgi:ubiquinone/menaquinone biosynthesis C-methylase UbiE